MKLRILGCSGGYAKGFHTTSALVDDDILLDAGTGVGTLPLDTLKKVKNVLVTHSHLDHTCSLCFLVDHFLEDLKVPTRIHCLPHTAAMIRENLLGGRLWPEIERVQIDGVHMIRIVEIEPYKSFKIDGRKFTPLPVDHVVPSVGYALHGSKGVFVYVSDMLDAEPRFWRWLNARDNITHIAVEAAFPSRMEDLAVLTKHLTPRMLKELLGKLRPRPRPPRILVTHMKPFYEKALVKEVREMLGKDAEPMRPGMEFEF